MSNFPQEPTSSKVDQHSESDSIASGAMKNNCIFCSAIFINDPLGYNNHLSLIHKDRFVIKKKAPSRYVSPMVSHSAVSSEASAPEQDLLADMPIIGRRDNFVSVNSSIIEGIRSKIFAQKAQLSKGKFTQFINENYYFDENTSKKLMPQKLNLELLSLLENDEATASEVWLKLHKAYRLSLRPNICALDSMWDHLCKLNAESTKSSGNSALFSEAMMAFSNPNLDADIKRIIGQLINALHSSDKAIKSSVKRATELQSHIWNSFQATRYVDHLILDKRKRIVLNCLKDDLRAQILNNTESGDPNLEKYFSNEVIEGILSYGETAQKFRALLKSRPYRKRLQRRNNGSDTRRNYRGSSFPLTY